MIKKYILALIRKINNLNLKRKTKYCGDNTIVWKPLHIQNLQCMEFGSNVVVSKGSILDCCYKSYRGKNTKPSLIIGDSVFMNYNCKIFCSDSIIIGEKTIFGPDCMIIDDNHSIEAIETDNTYCHSFIVKPVKIGNGVWIGGRTTILPGVTIGDRSIIGANSVVTKNIPEFSLAIGNPAKVIKKYDFEQHSWIRC